MLPLAAFVLSRLVGLALFAASAWAFGDTALRRLGIRRQDRSAALAATAGLGLIAQVLLLAGFLGGFRAPVILALFALGHLLCRGSWSRLAGRRLAAVPRGAALVGAAFGVLVTLGPIVLLALYPPMGWDATAYHLPYVRAFLEAGSPIFVAHLRYPVFPQVAETLFLAATVLGGDVVAKLSSTLALLLVAALLAEWGRRDFSPRTGRFAAALWLGTPLAVWLGTLAYVDVQLTLFVVAGASCWHRWRRTTAQEAPRDTWLALAGVFVGLAAGTKYLGLFFCGLFGLLTAIRALRRRRVAPVLIYGLAALFALAPWYGRIVAHTGNPVFPFYEPLFGESEWTTRHDEVVFGAADASGDGRREEGRLGGGSAQVERLYRGLGLLVRLPWSGVFERHNFFSVAPLTPWYLLLVPLLAPLILTWRGASGGAARGLLGAFFLYALFWLTIEHDLRFLLPGLALLDLALAAGFERLGGLTRRLGRRGGGVVLALLFAPGWLYAGYKIWEKGPLPVTATARADFLEVHIAGYGGVRWLDENVAEDYVAYGLYTGRLRHYATGRLLGDAWGPVGYRRVRRAMKSGAALGAELDEIGAGYLLTHRRWLPSRLRLDEDFRRRFHTVWQDEDYLLFELRNGDSASQSR